MNLAELYAQANQRNALARRREPLDAPFDPLRQIPAGMPPPLRTGDLASLALQNAPGIGDVASLIDAYRAWQMGDKLQGGLSAVAALPFVGAIKAYHGSPHTFDRFDMSKIGTGEGAQVYGHGLYFAEDPGVGAYYRDIDHPSLGPDPRDEVNSLRHNWQLGPNPRDLTDEDVRFLMKDYQSLAPLQDQRDVVTNIARMVNGTKPDGSVTTEALYAGRALDRKLPPKPQGNLYETSLQWPDPTREAADPLGPQHFLERGRPINEHSRFVLDALDLAGINTMSSADAGLMAMGQEKHLAAHGIPGIRYLDAGSRGTGTGTANYVVFDDQIPQIQTRNGQPLTRPDLTRQGIGAGPLRMATDDELRASLEAVHGRNAAKGLDADIATGAIRDEQARRNAVSMLGLPENNTAAERAAAMGFDTPAFRGTSADESVAKQRQFVSRNPDIASQYGGYVDLDGIDTGDLTQRDVYNGLINITPGGNVMPLRISDAPAATGRTMLPDYEMVSGAPHIRSRFAAFDPARRNEGNLLAQILGGVGLAHLYSAMTARPEDRP